MKTNVNNVYEARLKCLIKKVKTNLSNVYEAQVKCPIEKVKRTVGRRPV